MCFVKATIFFCVSVFFICKVLGMIPIFFYLPEIVTPYKM